MRGAFARSAVARSALALTPLRVHVPLSDPKVLTQTNLVLDGERVEQRTGVAQIVDVSLPHYITHRACPPRWALILDLHSRLSDPAGRAYVDGYRALLEMFRGLPRPWGPELGLAITRMRLDEATYARRRERALTSLAQSQMPTCAARGAASVGAENERLRERTERARHFSTTVLYYCKAI